MPRHQQYTDVRPQDHHDDDSSTEVESLVGNEKAWVNNEDYLRPSRSRRDILCPPCLSALRWFIVISLQVIIVGLLAREQGLLMDSKWTRAATLLMLRRKYAIYLDRRRRWFSRATPNTVFRKRSSRSFVLYRNCSVTSSSSKSYHRRRLTVQGNARSVAALLKITTSR